MGNGLGSWIDPIGTAVAGAAGVSGSSPYDLVAKYPLDPLGGSLSGALGVHSPQENTFALFSGNFGKMWKDDWRALKHMLMPDMRKDREQMINGAETARRIIYGRVRVAGQLVYACSAGNNKQNLSMMLAFAGHPVDAFETIYLDDKLITDSQFSGAVTYITYDGTQTAACPNMISDSGGIWTAAHVGRGCALMYVNFTYSDAAFPGGAFVTPKAVIRGKKVYDPRTGITAWSDNPALCALDYMITPSSEGGMGCEMSAAFNAAKAAGLPYTRTMG